MLNPTVAVDKMAALDAEIARLRKALREIANDSGFGAHNRMRRIARAALNPDN